MAAFFTQTLSSGDLFTQHLLDVEEWMKILYRLRYRTLTTSPEHSRERKKEISYPLVSTGVHLLFFITRDGGRQESRRCQRLGFHSNHFCRSRLYISLVLARAKVKNGERRREAGGESLKLLQCALVVEIPSIFACFPLEY